MQEVYNDACSQITDAQKTINVIDASTTPEDVEDASKIAKSKTDAQKVKDSAIKIKLEVAKLQSDIIKHSGNVDKAVDERSEGKANLEDFKSIREMLNKDQDIQDNNEQDKN